MATNPSSTAPEAKIAQHPAELSEQLRVARAEMQRVSAENQSLLQRIVDLEDTNLSFRTLADQVPQVIWTNEGNGDANYFNHRWYQYSGLTFEQSKGLGWQAIVHPDDAIGSKRKWLEALNAGETFDCEYRLRRADGLYRWFIGRNVPLHRNGNGVVAWFGTATDIQDLKEAQAAMREHEQQFRLAIEYAPIPVIMHAEDGEILHVSRTWTALTGYSRTNMPTFDAWLQQAYGQGADAVRTGMKKVFSGGIATEQAEFEINTLSGDRRHWIFSVSAPGTLSDGRRFAIGMALDVTDRKRTEDALADSQERLRLIVESAHEHAILTADLDRRLTSWNAGAERMVGYARTEVIGDTADLIFTPEDRAKGAPELEMGTALTYGRAADERWHLRKDGTRFWGSGVMLPMHGRPDGEIIGVVKIFRDETEKREARDALEASRKSLQAALDATESARAEAEVATRAKDHFIAVLSHELRTPLTPVLLAAHMLSRRADLPSPVQEALAMIRTNIQLEARLVDDLLDVTRIAQGKMTIIRAPMDMHEAIKRTAEICQPDFDAKHQKLSVQLNASERALEGDATRLQQVVWNLLKNAVKFTPNGGEVRVVTYNEPGFFVAEVSDTGIGIEAEALLRIFQPFTQANPDISRQFGGLGLGLSISRAAISAHGGDLTASSGGPGSGAVFTIRLPLNPAR